MISLLKHRYICLSDIQLIEAKKQQQTDQNKICADDQHTIELLAAQ